MFFCDVCMISCRCVGANADVGLIEAFGYQADFSVIPTTEKIIRFHR